MANEVNVKELMIGNFIQCDDVVYEVNSLYRERLFCLDAEADTHMIYVSNAKGIPINAEWLNKCGFTPNSWKEISLALSYGSLYAHENNPTEVYHTRDINDLNYDMHNSRILYVHQLQNYYLLNEGKELKITN